MKNLNIFDIILAVCKNLFKTNNMYVESGFKINNTKYKNVCN